MDFPSLGVTRHLQPTTGVSPEPHHDAASASDVSSMTTVDSIASSNSTQSTQLNTKNGVSASTMGKNTKTEYKSNFRPFDQYVYNSITDSFVHHHANDISAVSNNTTSDHNTTVSASPSPLDQPHTASGGNAHDSVLFEPTNGRHSNQCGDPWYKEVQRRNERANEYRFKSEVGHNSPLMMHHEQVSSSISPSASNQHLLDDGQFNGSGDGQQQAALDSTTDVISATSNRSQPVHRFMPSDYCKRDHMIAHMANNNNFNLPKDSVHNQRPATSVALSQTTNKTSLASRPGANIATNKVVSVGAPSTHRSLTRSAAQTRARSQSSRRQPISSGLSSSVKATPPPTKSAHTTPSRSKPAGQSNGTPVTSSAKSQVAARTPTSVAARKPAVSTTTPQASPACNLSSTKTRASPLAGPRKLPSSTPSRLTPTTTTRAATTTAKRSTPSTTSMKPTVASKASTRTPISNTKAPAALSLTNSNNRSRPTSNKPHPSSSGANGPSKTEEVRKVSSGRPSVAAAQSSAAASELANQLDSRSQPQPEIAATADPKLKPTAASTAALSESANDYSIPALVATSVVAAATSEASQIIGDQLEEPKKLETLEPSAADSDTDAGPKTWTKDSEGSAPVSEDDMIGLTSEADLAEPNSVAAEIKTTSESLSEQTQLQQLDNSSEPTKTIVGGAQVGVDVIPADLKADTSGLNSAMTEPSEVTSESFVKQWSNDSESSQETPAEPSKPSTTELSEDDMKIPANWLSTKQSSDGRQPEQHDPSDDIVDESIKNNITFNENALGFDDNLNKQPVAHGLPEFESVKALSDELALVQEATTKDNVEQPIGQISEAINFQHSGQVVEPALIEATPVVDWELSEPTPTPISTSKYDGMGKQTDYIESELPNAGDIKLNDNADENPYVRQCQQDFDLGEPYSMMPISSEAAKTSKEGSVSSLSHELNTEQLDEQLKRIDASEPDRPDRRVEEANAESDSDLIADTSAVLTSANTTLDETTLLPEGDFPAKGGIGADDEQKQANLLFCDENLIESTKEVEQEQDPPTLSNTTSIEPRIHDSSYGQPSNLDSGSEGDTSADEPDLVLPVAVSKAEQATPSNPVTTETAEVKQSELLMNIADLIDTGSRFGFDEQPAASGPQLASNSTNILDHQQEKKNEGDPISELVLLPENLSESLADAAPNLLELGSSCETNLIEQEKTRQLDDGKTNTDEFPLLDVSELKPTIDDPLLGAAMTAGESSDDEVLDDELRVIGRRLIPKLMTNDVNNDDDDDDNVDEDAMLDISKGDHHNYYQWERDAKGKPKVSDESDNDIDNDEQLKLTNSDDEFILKPRDGTIGSPLEPDVTGGQSEGSETAIGETGGRRIEHREPSEATSVADNLQAEAKQQQLSAVEVQQNE